jgi:hypothetical protein
MDYRNPLLVVVTVGNLRSVLLFITPIIPETIYIQALVHVPHFHSSLAESPFLSDLKTFTGYALSDSKELR